MDLEQEKAAHDAPKQQSTNRKLALEISSLSLSVEVDSFDGSEGTFVVPSSYQADQKISHLAELKNSETQQSLWSGSVVISTDRNGKGSFALGITPYNADDAQNTILWKELPPCLSVLDGGVTAMKIDEIAELIQEFVEFNDVVSCTLHFSGTDGVSYFPLNFDKQENLKTLTEFALQFKNAADVSKVKNGAVGVLEFELFEMTYFTVVFLNDTDEDYLFCGLTQHWYRMIRREGRRIRVSDLEIEQGKVLEISDFGLKLLSDKFPDAHPGTIVSLALPKTNRNVSFKVVYSGIFSTKIRSLGLQLAEDDPDVRKHWQALLLTYQYPSLKLRTPEYHASTWQLLLDSGYFEHKGVGALLSECRESVQKEWSIVDRGGPDIGASVVGIDEERSVATIGVNHVARGIWAAQAAAVIDNPKYLPFTRAMYGWRTRFILQQPDGLYHFALFKRGKRFLDRFFRKFYLEHGSHPESPISWDEAKYFGVQIRSRPKEEFTDELKNKGNESTIEEPARFDPQSCRALKLLAEAESKHIIVKNIHDATIVIGRQHLHLAQFFSSVWTKSCSQLSESTFDEFGTQPFAIILTDSSTTREELLQRLPNSNVIEGDIDVVWTCYRSLLSRFLSNSLRSLEQMCRKYGVKNSE